MSSAVFDAFAAGYDASFTDTRLGRMLRERVWAVLARYFRAGDHVLELACGTGEDAVWLAQQGVRVTATDGSPEMLQVARRKAEAAGVGGQIKFGVVDLGVAGEEWRVAGEERRVAGEGWRERRGDEPADVDTGRLRTDRATRSPKPAPVAGTFDGALSDFGGINVIGDWRPLAASLAETIRPGGYLVLVPMGPVCPWEIVWHLAHVDIKTAVRRLHPPATARIGGASIPIWYPSARCLRRDFAPWFRLTHTESLGLWLPPSYLSHLVDRHPGLFGFLDRLEGRTAHLTGGWGDHYVMVLRRETVRL